MATGEKNRDGKIMKATFCGGTGRKRLMNKSTV